MNIYAKHNKLSLSSFLLSCLQCFDTVGWAAGRASCP